MLPEQLFHLDPESEHSLQKQICEQMVKAILNGHIPPNKPLPSSRNLAGQLNDVRSEVGALQVEVALADDRRSTCDDLTLRLVLLAFGAAAGQLSAAEATSQVDDLKHERQFICEGVSLAP